MYVFFYLRNCFRLLSDKTTFRSSAAWRTCLENVQSMLIRAQDVVCDVVCCPCARIRNTNNSQQDMYSAPLQRRYASCMKHLVFVVRTERSEHEDVVCDIACCLCARIRNTNNSQQDMYNAPLQRRYASRMEHPFFAVCTEHAQSTLRARSQHTTEHAQSTLSFIRTGPISHQNIRRTSNYLMYTSCG